MQHRLPDRYVFNKKLREGAFVCEGEVLENLNAWRRGVDNDTKDFVERCKVVHQFFPALNGIKWKDFPAAMTRARKKVAADDDFIKAKGLTRRFLRMMSEAPSADLLTPDWAWFRYVQCQILAALRIFQKHQGRFPESPGQDFWRCAEHSMLDVVLRDTRPTCGCDSDPRHTDSKHHFCNPPRRGDVVARRLGGRGLTGR